MNKILIIDDNREIRELLVLIFKASSKFSHIISASSWTQGLDIIKNEDINIILSDKNLSDDITLETFILEVELNPEKIDLFIFSGDDVASCENKSVKKYFNKPILCFDTMINELIGV